MVFGLLMSNIIIMYVGFNYIFSLFTGEVQVHRLHWQKVWNLPPPKDNVVVDAMAWRPDGKV